MNDPHVAALLYRVEHSDNFSYEKAEPFEHEEPQFRVRIENGQARVEMKDHFAMAQPARAVVEPFLRAWELDVALKYGDPRALCFVYGEAELIDRNPPPGTVTVHGDLTVRYHLEQVKVLWQDFLKYPAPPMGLAVSPEVGAMHYIYGLYRAGNCRLGDAANFCLTVLKGSAGGRPEKKREAAAAKYYISGKVLSRLGFLASKKGGRDHSRKWEGWASEYTDQERAGIEAAIMAMIRRAAEVAYDPNIPRKMITLNDLPGLGATRANRPGSGEP